MQQSKPLGWGQIGGWLARWGALFALWMALVDTRKLPEIVAGAVAAALAATVAFAARRRTVSRLPSGAGLLRRGLRTLLRLPVETVIVAAALPRAIRSRGRRTGRLRAVRFRHTPDAEAAGRHVVSEYLGSVAPNRFVIGIDTSRQYMLVHELVRSDEPLDQMELG
jgi:hypothetical protein